MFATSEPVLWLPEVAFAPDHPPLAVHCVAFRVLQLSVAALPELTVVGLTVRVTVGAGGVPGGGVVVGVVALPDDPPPLQATSANISSAPSKTRVEWKVFGREDRSACCVPITIASLYMVLSALRITLASHACSCPEKAHCRPISVDRRWMNSMRVGPIAYRWRCHHHQCRLLSRRRGRDENDNDAGDDVMIECMPRVGRYETTPFVQWRNKPWRGRFLPISDDRA